MADEFGVRGTKPREKLLGYLESMGGLVREGKGADFAKMETLARSAAELALRRQFPAASSSELSPPEIAEANAALEIAQRELANEILSSFADGRRVESPGGQGAASRILEMSPEYKNLLEIFGAYPQGEKAARIFPVPKNTDLDDEPQLAEIALAHIVVRIEAVIVARAPFLRPACYRHRAQVVPQLLVLRLERDGRIEPAEFRLGQGIKAAIVLFVTFFVFCNIRLFIAVVLLSAPDASILSSLRAIPRSALGVMAGEFSSVGCGESPLSLPAYIVCTVKSICRSET
jgi:hypothetical protein